MGALLLLLLLLCCRECLLSHLWRECATPNFFAGQSQNWTLHNGLGCALSFLAIAWYLWRYRHAEKHKASEKDKVVAGASLAAGSTMLLLLSKWT